MDFKYFYLRSDDSNRRSAMRNFRSKKIDFIKLSIELVSLKQSFQDELKMLKGQAFLSHSKQIIDMDIPGITLFS